MNNKKILEMRNIWKGFSGVAVLQGVNIDLQEGEVHGLVGENGAGKSTLIKILGGIYTKDKGEVLLDGKIVEIKQIHEAQEYGICIIHQELSLVPEMKVYENIFLGRMPKTKLGFVDDEKAIKKTTALLHDFGMEHIDAQEKVSKYSIAQQQMIEIMRALSTKARILVMDEPTASLTETEIKIFFTFIKVLQGNGTSIIYISHRLEELFQLCKRSTILRDGKYIDTVNMDEINYDGLVSLMVGRKFENIYPKYEARLGKELLRVENLNAGKQVQNIHFTLRQGEILGLYGLIGSGRTESMCALFGVSNIRTSGDFYLEEKKITINTSSDAIKQGIMLAPESRKENGLVMIQNIKFNTTLAILHEIIKGIKYDKTKENEITMSFMKRLDLRASGLEQRVLNLSGGNQQKVVLAKCLATKPRIIILDEPTRGIDVGAKISIYNLITQLAEEGIGIIFISSEMSEVVNLCTRVIIMREGKIRGELSGDLICEDKIIKYSLGGPINDKQ